MDRQIVQPGAIPQDTDLLNTNRYAMVALGMALKALMGNGPFVDGAACAPVGGTMQVTVGPGSIYTLAAIDNTAYGSLPADTTDQIIQQGLVFGNTTFTLAAPGTAGQSQYYLIEGQFQQLDENPQTLLYYNSANPSQPLTGPGGSGVAQNTTRGGVFALQVKAGTAAASPAIPAVDAGWTALYTVLVANGQTSIVAGNIATAAAAPFITNKAGSLGALALLNIGLGLKNDGAGNLAVNVPDSSLLLTSSGLRANSLISGVSTNQSIGAGSHFQTVVNRSASTITLTLAINTGLWNGFCFTAYAQKGPITLTPNAANKITVGSVANAAGASVTIPLGGMAFVVLDDTGNWSISEFLGSAAQCNSSSGNNTLPVASVNGAVTAGHVAVFGDNNGTVIDGGPLNPAVPPTGVSGATSLQPGAYVCDTAAGAFTVTLIPTTVNGQGWIFYDRPTATDAGSWGINNLTINLNGMTLTMPNGMTSNTTLVVNTSGENFMLTYDAANSTLRIA